MPQPEYVQRGYLREDFRLFHLKGPMEEQLDWHYHTFHKLIFFLGGTSSYGLEGRSYPLEAGDVILVPQGCVHRPEAAPGAPYERVILYLSAEFLSRAGGADCPLDSCFTLAKTSFRFVLRPQDDRQALRQTLEDAYHGQGVLTVPFTDQVPAYMHAADVLLSKAGGISSSEAAMLGVPLVHTMAIPGVETENAAFFARHGLSFFARSVDEAARFADRLIYDPACAERMLAAQAAWLPRNGAEQIAAAVTAQ